MSPFFHKHIFFRKTALHKRVRPLFRKLCSGLCVGVLLFLPCGCSSSSAPSGGNTPLPSKEKITSETRTFSVFLDNFFRNYATSDSLSLHYTVQNPAQLQLEKPTVSLGHLSEEALLASNKSATEYLERLHAFSKDTLSETEQLYYDLLEYALENSILPDGTFLYDTPLGPTTGVQTQLPILLAEYRFSSLEDVEDYFLLLEDLPRYFTELCAFEQARFTAGTQSCAEVLSRILLQCTSFVENPGDNFLIESFKDRLAVLPDVTAAQTAELCIRNQKLVFTKVIPAYEQLIETLQGLLDTSAPAKGLCALPNGTAYYEYLVRSHTGSDRPIAEIEAMLERALTENMVSMLTLYESETLRAELEEYQKQGLHAPSASETSADTGDADSTVSVSGLSACLLEQLREQILADFPAPAEASYRVELIHPSLEDFISPALYLVPPLDAYKENVIYINQAKCAPESLFSTLAHEGYPGHLYQNTYFAATSPHPVRMLLNFTGYDEGWGTYAELFSYRYADCSEELRQFLTAEQIAGLCLYSLSDIRIHYHGADLDTIVNFLGKYGFSAEIAQEIFYTLLAEPVVYLPYSVGYLEFCELRDRYLEAKGTDASLLPFHTFLLETGPAPFSLLRTRLEETFR